MACVHSCHKAPLPSCVSSKPSSKEIGQKFHFLKQLQNTEQNKHYADTFASKVASGEMKRLNKLFDPESLNLDDGFNSKTSEEQELINCVLKNAQTTDITIGQRIKNFIYKLRDAAYEKAYDDFMSNVPVDTTKK